MTHVRTSLFYPQSNGKIERWHKSLNGECIRPGTPLSLDDARRLVSGYVDHYNNDRLNSATGYITSNDMLAGRSGRSTRSATGSWRKRGGNGRFVAGNPLDVQLTSVGRGSGWVHPPRRRGCGASTVAVGATSDGRPYRDQSWRSTCCRQRPGKASYEWRVICP